MDRCKRVAFVTATVICLLFVGIILILPGILRTQAVQWVATNTNRTLAIDRISINPFTLSIEVHGLALSEAAAPTPFVSFDRLCINISARSLLERGPIVKKLQLVRPSIRLIRTAANSYNFDDLLNLDGKKTAAPEDQASKPLRFSLNNITVTDGTIDFFDQAVMPSSRHRVEELQLAIPFIGNVAYLVDEYVTPLLMAKVNDAPLVFEGRLKPFSDTVEASVDIDIDNLDLPEYVPYLPGELPVRVVTGHLSSMLGISYRVSREVGPQVALSGDITLTGLSLTESNGTPLCFLPLGKLAFKGTKLLSEQIDLDEVLIYGLELTLNRNLQGIWNFERLTSKAATNNDTVQNDADSAGTTSQLTISNVRLRGGRLHFFDEYPAGGFTSRLREISFDLRNFSTGGGVPSAFALSFESERKERAAFAGSFSLKPFAATAKIAASDIPIEAYYPYLASVLTRSPSGLLKASGEMMLDDAGALRLKNGAITIEDFRLPFSDSEGLRLGRIGLSGIAVDSRERRAGIGLVEAENGDLRFSRDADGVLSPLGLLQTAPSTNDSDSLTSPPFSWHIARLDTNEFDVTFVDGMRSERPTHALRNITLAIDNLRSDGPSFDMLTARAGYGKEGLLNLSASGRTLPLDIIGKVRLRRIPLTGINAYLPANIHLEMVSADLDSELDFHLQEQSAGMTGAISGDLGVRNFYTIETISGDDLILWESLQLNSLRANLSPLSLRIGGVALNDFQARVIINPDGSLNLQRVLAGDDETSPPDSPTAHSRPEIIIDSITLQKGILDFTDRHMRPTFNVKMLNLGGHIGSMSSRSGKPAEVDLRGNLRNESPLSISGSIDPLADRLFLDLKIRFSDIELSPASPYAGRYLGYLVEKGKLFLDLDYHIENHRLESRNRIFLDQFTFGEKVESADATSLPVRLAVALLKDRRGEIHLDLPVTGRTDDPQFSIWGIVWQVLKNLLLKAATSPVALLTSMFGSGEEFSTVLFPDGSSRLVEAEQEKLLKLAAAINDRPALKLEIMGYADSERDPEAYRNELLQQKIRREKLLEQVKNKEATPGATIDSVMVTPEEESKYLEIVYRKADFPKPRNILGLTKGLPDAEMRKLLLTNIPAGVEEMEALAWGRAAAVRSFLVNMGGVPTERIFQKRVDIFLKKEGTSGNRVEFGIAAP